MPGKTPGNNARKPRGSLLIERFEQRVPGFNKQSLGLDALYAECERRRILVREIPQRRLHGCSFYDKEGPCLYINSLLKRGDRVVAGWHEFTHLVEHPPNADTFLSLGNCDPTSKYERQAQIVGVLALMPDAEAWGLSVPELIERYDVTEEIAKFRVELMF